jgi:hypothetical protein
VSDLLSALGHAAVYAAAASVLLVVAYYVLDLVTPGHLGSHLLGTDETVSSSAGVVTGAWLVSTALVLFTAIWTNGETSLGMALGWTVAFGVFGIALNAVMLFLIDAITPGNLREIVCEPGPVRPLAVVAAATALSVAAIVCASIA